MSGLGWRSDIGACVSTGKPVDWEKKLADYEGTQRQYRKRPVVIEAVRLSANNYRYVADWCDARITNTVRDKNDATDSVQIALEIKTLEGRMICNIGDWVIKGIKGEFYPCRDDIFQGSYEPQVYEAQVVDG